MPPPIFGYESLCDHGAETRRELDPDLLLPEGGEDVDDSVDGLRGIVGVQGREDEVTGLGQGQGELDGLEVTHLTDQQDVRVLAESRAQRTLEGGAVDADLTLADRRQAVGVDVLDGILDGEDVERACLVDAGDNRRQGGRLSRAGRTGHQYETREGAWPSTRRREAVPAPRSLECPTGSCGGRATSPPAG